MFERICIIVLVNFVFFAKTLCYKYSSDDIPVFQNPPKFKDNIEKLRLWLNGALRINPQADHFLTLIYHTIVCIFIFLAFGKNDVSFIAAILFSLNPSNNQGSVWISGRSYVLAALGMTGALAFPYLGAIFLVIAISTNPGFIAPVCLIGSNHWLLLAVAPIGWWIHGKTFKRNVTFKMEKEMYKEDKEIKIEKLVMALKTFGFYTALAIIPFKNTFYHAFLQSAAGSGKEKAYSIKDRFFWIGLIIALVILTRFCFHKWDMINFGLLWWCVCLAPFTNFMRMSQEIAERYMYLPNCGLMIVLASVLVNYPLVVIFFYSMYATRMWFLMDMYQDDYYLLEHSCLLSPDSWFGWHVRGMRRWDQKSYQEAVIIWTMARMISPNEFKINFNLATALIMSGHKKEAEFFIKLAEDNIPGGQEAETKTILDRWKKGELAVIL